MGVYLNGKSTDSDVLLSQQTCVCNRCTHQPQGRNEGQDVLGSLAQVRRELSHANAGTVIHVLIPGTGSCREEGGIPPLLGRFLSQPCAWPPREQPRWQRRPGHPLGPPLVSCLLCPGLRMLRGSWLGGHFGLSIRAHSRKRSRTMGKKRRAPYGANFRVPQGALYLLRQHATLNLSRSMDSPSRQHELPHPSRTRTKFLEIPCTVCS